nr:hypothetical protein [uncultured Butyricicoccus sp.]
MVNNEIFEVEKEEEVEVLGKCPICGKVCTEENEDEFREVYFSETDSYEYVCEDCKDNGYYSFCDACQGDYPCVRPDSEFVEVWEDAYFGGVEKNYVCKSIIRDTDCYEKCEKCGVYCTKTILDESGLCPDCEEEAEEDED